VTVQPDVHEIGRDLLPHSASRRVGHADRDGVLSEAFGTSSSNQDLWRNSIACRVLFQCRKAFRNFSNRSGLFVKKLEAAHHSGEPFA
jgi:hypothetical protein